MLAVVLIGLALTSSAVNMEIDHNEESLIEPFELGETRRGGGMTNPGHNHNKAMKNLKTEVEGAKSPKDAAAKMKSTISKAMKSKEKELLSGSMPKKVEKRPEPPKPKPRRKKPYRSNTRELKQKEGEEKAKVKLAKSRGLRLAVQQKNAESQSRHRLNMKKMDAEKKAATATAKRMAAEENAKTVTVDNVAHKEAKKYAWTKAKATTRDTKPRAAGKSPEEVNALEADAYKQAAALKVKEGLALQRMAALQQQDSLQAAGEKAEDKAGDDENALESAKTRLKGLVSRAKNALSNAKSKPFDAAALQRVVKMRAVVKQGKQQVLRLSKTEQTDKKIVKKIMKKQERTKPKQESSRKSSRSMEKGPAVAPKKNTLRRPDVKHMDSKQIRYWANKKMKWRAENPLKKDKVMAKIFAIKNREAATLTKMNVLNTGIGMKTTGFEAAMLKKGRNVIVNGELIKPSAMDKVRVRSTFQGKKGVNPRLYNKSRDPKTDKKMTMKSKDLDKKVASISDTANKEINAARDIASGKVHPRGTAPGTGLKDLKKAIKANKAIVPDAEVKTHAGPDEHELGDDDEEASMTKEDQESDDDEEDLLQKEDQEQFSDDNQMNEVMDETGLEDDAEDMEPDKEEYY
jgi:hypothetical protein